jgi:acetylornithine deacetylase/succinyl-diaminopimelate desuccinylase-like protein
VASKKGFDAVTVNVGRFLLVPLLVSVSLAAQERAAEIGALLLKDSAVRAAVEAAKKNEPWVLEEQVRLCEIPAPPFKEGARANAYAQAFRDLGLRNVRIDREGNVRGERPGLVPRPHVVLSAHLDTVFPEGTDVRVKREGTILRGPGIGDDCRGLAVVLGVGKALDEASVQTEGTITFVGTVGEEGLGDLRGVKHLFNGELKGTIDRFVSVDGTGLGITHIGVGSHRYRVAFKGPGGHSYGAFGLANPIHALGRAIAKIGDVQVPSDPKTTFNVGRVGGGTSVNSIAFEAWMEIDLRSADAAALQAVEANVHRAIDAALDEENLRWNNRGKLAVEKTLVGDRPTGRTADSAPIVRAATSVTAALGLPVTLDEGSTDANIPMSLGIPAITIDGGGRGTGAHSLGETFDATNSWQGTQRALLLAVALARR